MRGFQSRGAATVELCLTAPLLFFLLAAAADFARVYYYAQALTNCAWNGAALAADSDLFETLPYQSLEEATLAGAEHLVPPPAVEVQYGTDALEQPYAEVTVRWRFRPLLPLPKIPALIDMERTARMRLRPQPEEDTL